MGLLGDPVAHSLSPQMQNAAFAARGLDWALRRVHVRRSGSRRRCAGSRALGFAGANVTTPHKAAVARCCDEAERASVNTLVFRDGRVLGHEHRRGGASTGLDGRARRRSSAPAARRVASRAALPADARVLLAREATGRPRSTGADLIVNATRSATRCWSSSRAGQTGRRPPLPGDGDGAVAAARAGGAR